MREKIEMIEMNGLSKAVGRELHIQHLRFESPEHSPYTSDGHGNPCPCPIHPSGKPKDTRDVSSMPSSRPS